MRESKSLALPLGYTPLLLDFPSSQPNQEMDAPAVAFQPMHDRSQASGISRTLPQGTSFPTFRAARFYPRAALARES